MTWDGRILIVGIAILSVSFVIVASVNTKRIFMARCTVVVLDKDGRPAEHVRVSEHWDAYSYDLYGGGDEWTDDRGQVNFPERTGVHSLLYWQLRPILTRLNYGVHASAGTVASVGISQPGEPVDQETPGFSCNEEKCSEHPIELQFQVKWR